MFERKKEAKIIRDLRQASRKSPHRAIEIAERVLHLSYYSNQFSKEDTMAVAKIIDELVDREPDKVIEELSYAMFYSYEGLDRDVTASLSKSMAKAIISTPKGSSHYISRLMQPGYSQHLDTAETTTLSKILVDNAKQNNELKEAVNASTSILKNIKPSQTNIDRGTFILRLQSIIKKGVEENPEETVPKVVSLSFELENKDADPAVKTHVKSLMQSCNDEYPEHVFKTMLDYISGSSKQKEKIFALSNDVLGLANKVKNYNENTYLKMTEAIESCFLEKEKIDEVSKNKLLDYLDFILQKPAGLMPVMQTVKNILTKAQDNLDDNVNHKLIGMMNKGLHLGYAPSLAVAADLILENKEYDKDTRGILIDLIESSPAQLAGMSFHVANKLVLEADHLELDEKRRLHHIVHSLISDKDPKVKEDAMQSMANIVAEKLGICDGELLMEFARAVLSKNEGLNDNAKDTYQNSREIKSPKPRAV
jgi:hypothetical protein